MEVAQNSFKEDIGTFDYDGEPLDPMNQDTLKGPRKYQVRKFKEIFKLPQGDYQSL
jgi:hypothetical protein